jgi:hypothetical protein
LHFFNSLTLFHVLFFNLAVYDGSGISPEQLDALFATGAPARFALLHLDAATAEGTQFANMTECLTYVYVKHSEAMVSKTFVGSFFCVCPVFCVCCI